jgi:hypothetical protein
VDQARPLAGQRCSAWRTLAGKADPRRLPPTSEPRHGNRLVRGALAGSGPGTSPCIDGLSLVTGIVVPGVLLVQTMRTTMAVLSKWHGEADARLDQLTPFLQSQIGQDRHLRWT